MDKEHHKLVNNMGFIHNAGMRPNALPRIRWKNIYFVHLTKYTYEKTTTVNFGHVGMIPTHDLQTAACSSQNNNKCGDQPNALILKIF